VDLEGVLKPFFFFLELGCGGKTGGGIKFDGESRIAHLTAHMGGDERVFSTTRERPPGGG